MPIAKILFWTSMASWGLFLLVWAAMTLGNKESVHRQPWPDRLAYVVPLWLGIVLLANFPRGWPPLRFLARHVLPHHIAMLGISAGLCLAGAALAVWARVTLGRNWSAAVTLKDDHALVTSGPYGLIRHPIYTAIILLCAGLVFISGTVGALAGLLLIALSCWIKLHQEEALMLAQFPADYPGYRARTARLVPFLL